MEFPPPPASPAPRPRRRRLGHRLEIAIALVLIGTVGTAILVPLTRGGQYAFLETKADGSPIRWDPCRPIHYVTNLKLAPRSEFADVQEAVRRVSEATGIRFVYDGPSSELPQGVAPPGKSVSTRPGEDWAPLLIAWVDAKQFAVLSDNNPRAAALAYPIVGPNDFYVSGFVAVNASDELLPGFGFGPTSGPVLLHELGHIIGLGHVPSTAELMNAQENPVITDWGKGDLEGLRQLGREAGCPATTSDAA
jgi:hypothetical protein